jgi:hypothetical protein
MCKGLACFLEDILETLQNITHCFQIDLACMLSRPMVIYIRSRDSLLRGCMRPWWRNNPRLGSMNYKYRDREFCRRFQHRNLCTVCVPSLSRYPDSNSTRNLVYVLLLHAIFQIGAHLIAHTGS